MDCSSTLRTRPARALAPRCPGPALASICLGSALMAFAAPATAAPTVPANFVVENVVPGAIFDLPTGIAYLPDGRLLVAERQGKVWVVQNGTKLGTPFWSRPSEVLSRQDLGLLDVAVDPNFATNRYVYFLFTVDPDSNNTDTDGDCFSRLVRFQTSLSNPNVVDPTTRAVLFGRTWAEGPPGGSATHSIGALRWGTDGSLLVSVGDGAQYTNVDSGGRDPNLFLPGRANPYEDIGAFRAQYIGSLDGKILRLNPANGQGYASNPFYDGNLGSVRSRVWAYGLRNPFRFGVRPGSGSTNTADGDPGTLYIGDVGWENWEELSIATQGGRNFGWPCYEGLHDNTRYQDADPAHHGCGTIGTADNPSPHTPPIADWNHWNPALSSPSGYKGNAAAGSLFYTGTAFPSQYQGAYFFADYGGDWIRAAQMDASDNIVQILPFATDMDAPVDLILDPTNQHLVYVSIATGEIRRIRYTGPSNGTPTAVASANPSTGPAPLEVSFSSAGSTDPDQDPLTFSWDFGDGSGSTLPSPSHTYNSSGGYTATLTVDDGKGGTDTDQEFITVGTLTGFPTTAVLDNFNRANGALGAPWIDPMFGDGACAIQNNAVVETAGTSASPTWNGAVFGPDQEAYVTLSALTPNAPEHDLKLKVQGTEWSSAYIEVRWDSRYNAVQISTYEFGVGWVPRDTEILVSFSAGDQFGARALASGQVEVYKNGVLLGTRSLGDWPYAALGGRIGFLLASAWSSRLDDFGGGTYVPTPANTPPTAVIAAPADGAFYTAGAPLSLQGDASDAEESASALAYHWDVALHHNNHIHPGAFVSDNRDDSFLPEDHEDGTGTWMTAQLRVTDGGGLSDTTEHVIHPEVDLEPSAVTVTPDPAQSVDKCTFAFTLYNHGRMASRRFHWTLLLGATVLDEGDTLIAGLDSVAFSRWLDVAEPAGNHDLRLVVDTLAVTFETDESNNAQTRSLAVVAGPVSVDPGAAGLQLSQALPNPTRGKASIGLLLPRTSSVEFSVHDLQGRKVYAAPPREMGPGRWTLLWDGRGAGTGLYLARVRVDGVTWVRRIALVR